jgi:hypothetical protein
MNPREIKQMLDKQAIYEVVKQFAPDMVSQSKGLNFRCVLCGDSKKSRSKKRGWVLYGDESCTYYCFNCGASMSLRTFLKENYPDLHKRLFKSRTMKQMLSSSGKIKVIEPTVAPPEIKDCSLKFMENSFPLFEKQTNLHYIGLQIVALKMIQSRLIPKEYYKDWRICIDGEYRNRLLIPFFDGKHEKIYCFQARDLTDQSDSKYMTYKPEGNPKIFNLESVDAGKDVFILEGPIDAMFLNNAIATAGIAHWESALYDQVKSKFPHRVWVFDNDKDGVTEAIEYAKNGERVFCWPKEFKQKDINQLKVEKGLTLDELHAIIQKNTCTKLKAVMQLRLR